MTAPTNNDVALQRRIYELEETVLTLAAWLVSAQTGFGKQDYQAIADIVVKNRNENPLPDSHPEPPRA